jgi:hypothetical protein
LSCSRTSALLGYRTLPATRVRSVSVSSWRGRQLASPWAPRSSLVLEVEVEVVVVVVVVAVVVVVVIVMVVNSV